MNSNYIDLLNIVHREITFKKSKTSTEANHFFFQLVCIIVDNESDVAAFKDFIDDTPAPVTAAPPPPPPPKPAASAPTPTPSVSTAPTTPKSAPIQVGSRILASPLAKRLAAEKGLDLSVSIYYKVLSKYT